MLTFLSRIFDRLQSKTKRIDLMRRIFSNRFIFCFMPYPYALSLAKAFTLLSNIVLFIGMSNE